MLSRVLFYRDRVCICQSYELCIILPYNAAFKDILLNFLTFCPSYLKIICAIIRPANDKRVFNTKKLAMAAPQG